MTGRLGSTDFVNTIVIAHPGGLTQAQIRAIKVNLTLNSWPSHGLTRVSLQVPSSWVLAEGKTELFCFRCALRHLSLPIIDDEYFKDKDVEATRAILKEQEEKPDHVDYEITVYKGTLFFHFFRVESTSDSGV